MHSTSNATPHAGPSINNQTEMDRPRPSGSSHAYPPSQTLRRSPSTIESVMDSKLVSNARKVAYTMQRHLKFVGPGLVSSVAYFDPGNWTVDLSAGSQFGYKLLFIVLMAGLGAAVLQVLSLRLGITTTLSLPAQIRALFLRMKAHPRIAPYKWRRNAVMCGLYGLYGLAELAIIATDLAELLGSAIALNLIFPKLPLYAGVLLTVVDVLIVLAFFQRPDKGRKGMMAFEILIVCLVLCVLVCFVILLVQIKPRWGDVFHGFVPSSTIVQPEALYVSVGIIGATVMPHGLFLGSHLATIDRLDTAPQPPTPRTEEPSLVSLLRRVKSAATSDSGASAKDWKKILTQGWRKQENPCEAPEAENPEDPAYDADRVEKWEKEQVRYEAEVKAFDRVDHVKTSIAHSTVDTVLSLLGFAVTINSAILILASAAFYYGGSEAIRQAGANADLFSAHQLINDQINKAAAFIFAFALLCSGQSSSITATLAGVVVSEGFIEWKTNPIVRRLITRAISIVPSCVVAIAVGRSGVNQLLVASQVCLSVVLPFIVFPLVWICSDKQVMTVKNPSQDVPEVPSREQDILEANSTREIEIDQERAIPSRQMSSTSLEMKGKTYEEEPAYVLSTNEDVPGPQAGQSETSNEPKQMSFASHWTVTVLGYALFGVVTLANAYVLVMLMMGK